MREHAPFERTTSPDPAEPGTATDPAEPGTATDSTAGCPRCGAAEARPWGFHRGRRRWRCGRCRRTWTAGSEAAADGIRKRAAWLKHLEAMFAGRPLREAAAELGVTVRTAARWRRRVMHLIWMRLPRTVGGRVEVMPFRRLDTPWQQLVVLVDGTGRAAALVLPRNPRPAHVAEALRHHVEAGSEIVLSYGRSVFSRGAEAAGFRVEISEVEAARRYAYRLNRWLCAFHGTEQTPGYLAWFDALQSAGELEPFVARWAAEAERRAEGG